MIKTLVFEFFCAQRYLIRSKNDGFLSVIGWFSFIGIAIGVSALIIVMSVMNGFRIELFEKIFNLNGHIVIKQINNKNITLDSDILNILKKEKNINSVRGVIEEQILISNQNGRSFGALLRGVSSIYPRKNWKNSIMKTNNKSVSFSDTDPENGGVNDIVIAKTLGQRLMAQDGDIVNLTTAKGIPTPFGKSIRSKKFMVGGFMDLGMSEYNRVFVFSSSPAVQSFIHQGQNSFSYVDIMLNNPDDAETVTKNLLSYQKIKGCCAVLPWQQSNKNLYNALMIEKNVMFLILTLILIIATLNIVSGLVMFTKSKSLDIAILRSMGCPRSSVLRIFLIIGTSIGCFGTGTGVVIGVYFCKNIESIRLFLEKLTGLNFFSSEIYFLSNIPSEINTTEIWTISLISITLSVLSALYPAWKASQVNPLCIFQQH